MFWVRFEVKSAPPIVVSQKMKHVAPESDAGEGVPYVEARQSPHATPAWGPRPEAMTREVGDVAQAVDYSSLPPASVKPRTIRRCPRNPIVRVRRSSSSADIIGAIKANCKKKTVLRGKPFGIPVVVHRVFESWRMTLLNTMADRGYGRPTLRTAFRSWRGTIAAGFLDDRKDWHAAGARSGHDWVLPRNLANNPER